jgi:hypothetical protein
MNTRFVLLAGVVLFGLQIPCHADETDKPALLPDLANLPSTTPILKLSGFGTAGYIDGGNDDLYFVRDISQDAKYATNNGWDADSRIGVQANLNVSDHWGGVIQLVDRYKVAPTLQNSVEWAFLSFSPTSDTTIRAGRVGMDIFALSDFRNVGYAYTWVRPPQEFYGWIPLYSIDGADVATNLDLGEISLRAKLFAGISKANLSVSGESDYALRLDNVYGTSVGTDYGNWSGRLSYVHAMIADESPLQDFARTVAGLSTYWPQATGYADDLLVKGGIVQYTGVALNYDLENWQVRSEVSYVTSDVAVLSKGSRAYLSVGKRFDQWLPYLMFAKSTDPGTSNVVAPPGFGFEPVAAGINEAINSSRIRQSTWSTGVRWDFAPHMDAKFQIDRVDISNPGAGMWQINSPTWNGGSRTLVTATMDFVF